MPDFIVTTPQGRFKVTGVPDEAAAYAAVAGQTPTPTPAKPPEAAAPDPTAGKGAILPFSWDKSGVRFDPNAGVLGLAQNAVRSAVSGATLPGDVYTGKTDPLSNEGVDRAIALGSMVVPPSAASKAALAPSWLRSNKVPTADAIQAAAKAGYKQAEGMGVVYSSDALAQAAGAARQQMEGQGIVKILAPKTFSILHDLENPPAGSVAPYTGGVDAARKALQRIKSDYGASTSGEEREAARRAVAALDAFVENPPPQAVLAGPSAAVAATSKEARGNAAAVFRSSDLTGIGQSAELRSWAANSGVNLDNQIRSRVASLLLDPSRLSGFTPTEQAALKGIVKGTVPTNALRMFGNMLGGGGGLGAAVSGTIGASAGAAAAGPIGALVGPAVPAIGYGLKVAENWRTKAALQEADIATRARSPFAQQQSKGVPPTMSPSAKAEIVRFLLLGENPAGYEAPTQLRSTTGKPIPAGTPIY